jgi:hypothetical protein
MNSSHHMGPRLAAHNLADGVLVDSEHLAYNALNCPICSKATHLPYVVVCQFGVRVSLPESWSWRNEMPLENMIPMQLILAWSHVFDVAGPVVDFDAVFVVDRVTIRARADECGRHDSMNQKLLVVGSGSAQLNFEVSGSVVGRCEQFAVRGFSLGPLVFEDAPDIPEVRHDVSTLVSYNRPPFLVTLVVSHDMPFPKGVLWSEPAQRSTAVAGSFIVASSRSVSKLFPLCS